MPARIRVSMHCIEEGEPSNPRECPIALALAAALPELDFYSIYVGCEGWIRFSLLERDLDSASCPYYRGWMPPEARAFIDEFDENGFAPPIEFAVSFRKVNP